MPDAITHNALIIACEKGKLPERALHHLDQRLCEVGCSRRHAKQHGTQPERAVKVFESMLQQDVMSDSVDDMALISAGGKGQQPERALKVSAAILDQGAAPNAVA